MVNTKNPHFMEVRRKNIQDLMTRLNEAKTTDEEGVDKILAKFAIERGLRIERVEEYYRTLKMAGLVK
jgi:predicted solute-binding protein